jgi:perosamine synthetase
MIPIYKPQISKKARKYVKDCMDSTWISSQGTYIKKFETALAKFHNMKYCVVTSSCTTSLHLSILSLGLKRGDEVICSALSFIAPANMVLLSNLKLVLVDINSKTLNIDENKIEEKISKKTKAIIVVHQFGHSANMKKIIQLKKKYNLKVIEDNAESIGGKFYNKLNGTMSDLSTLSFFANKIITTGEGGAILTNNKKLYEKCLEMRDHGMDRNKRYFHKFIGFNYRMTNLQAAIGFSQIKEIQSILKRRNHQMEYYYKLLSNNKNYKPREFEKWCKPVHWLTTIILNKKKYRNKLISFLKRKKIDSRQMVNPINDALHIKKLIKKKYPVANDISKRSIHLPSGLELSKKNINYIILMLNSFFQNEH